MSQFAEYVQSKNLTVDRIFHCSARLERHHPDDRRLSVQRQALRRAGKVNGYAEANVAKPRSGRGVSRRRIEMALAGRPLTARVRAKLARAIVALAGGDAPDVRALFGDVQASHGGTPATAAGETAGA